VDNGTRDELLSRLAAAVVSVTVAHPTRVAVDGPPAAGKTTLADELAAVLRAQGREVIRATIESFLFPRAQRYRRGEYSPEGCYFDTHDCDALNRVLLDPLGPGGDRRFQHAVYDRSTDTALSPQVTTAPADAVMVFDGVFLMRPQLIDRWDLCIFVSTGFEETIDRAVLREQGVLSAADVQRRWRDRYIPLNGSTSPRSPRPITPTSSCTTTTSSDRHGRPERCDRTHRYERELPPTTAPIHNDASPTHPIASIAAQESAFAPVCSVTIRDHNVDPDDTSSTAASRTEPSRSARRK
jgi:uridine kinase